MRCGVMRTTISLANILTKNKNKKKLKIEREEEEITTY